MLLGIGAGIDRNRNTLFLPLSLDARAIMLKKKISPVINMNMGYTLELSCFSSQSKPFLNPCFGINADISHRAVFLLNAGIRWQSERLTYYNRGTTAIERKIARKYITINEGLLF